MRAELAPRLVPYTGAESLFLLLRDQAGESIRILELLCTALARHAEMVLGDLSARYKNRKITRLILHSHGNDLTSRDHGRLKRARKKALDQHTIRR